MPTVGSINVVLSAQSSSFTSTVNKAGESLEHLSEKAGEAGNHIREKLSGLGSIFSGGGIEGAASSLSSGLSGIAGSAASALSSLGPVGIAIGAVAVAAAAAAAAVIGLGLAAWSIVEPQMEAIDANYKLANSLGVPIDQLMTFQELGKRTAHVAKEDVSMALEHMAKNLGEAASAGGPPKAALDSLGLSATKLANGGLGGAFTEIAQKISEIKNPAEQALIATELFGKAGAKLLPLFNEGAEGIEKARQEFLKTGQALNQMDAAKVVAAHEAIEALGGKIEGLKNTLTVALAPVIMALGEEFTGLLPSVEGFRSFTIGALKVVAYGVAGVVDGYRFLKIGVLGAGYGFTAMAEGALHGLDAISKAVVWLANKLGANWKVPKLFADGAETAKAVRQSLGEQIGEAVHQQSAVSKVGGVFDDINAKVDAKAKELMEHGKEAGGALSEGFAEGAKKIKEVMEQVEKELGFQKFLGSDKGKQLAGNGLTSEQIKKFYEASILPGGDKITGILEKKLLDTNALENLNKGTETLRKLREELANLQAGGDKKLVDLHLIDPAQRAEADSYLKSIEKLKSANEVADSLRKLREEVEALQEGMDKGVAELKLKGATTEQQDEFQSLQDRKKMLEDSKKLFEDTRTPLEKYDNEIGKLGTLLQEGVIDWDLYGRGVKKAQADLHKDLGEDKKQKTAKSETSSVAFQAYGQNETPRDPLVDLGKQQLEQQKKQSDLLGKIQAKDAQSIGTFDINV